MKKIMMIAAMMLLSVGAFAQGKFAVGANAGIALYGDDYNPFGVGAKLQYGFDGGFRTELAYNYWFAKEEAGVKAGVMDIDLNLHGDSESIFGFQGGFGIEYYLSDNVKLNLDAKYQYNKKTVDYDIMGYKTSIDMKFDGPVIQAGIAYVF